MQQLSRHDFEQLLAGLRQLYGCLEAEEFPKTALAVCSQLIPNALAAYTEIDSRKDTWKAECESPDALQALVDHQDSWLEHFHDHPVLNYYEREAEPEARAISDFFSVAQWHRQPLYNEFFRRLGFADQLVLPIPKRTWVALGICLNRDRRGFTSRERTIAVHLRNHLLQASRNVGAIEALRMRLAQWERVAAAVGMTLLVVSEQGKIIEATPDASRLLERYFDWRTYASGLAPQTVRRWVASQAARIRGADVDFLPPKPLVAELEGSRLILKLYPHERPDSFLIVICERRRPEPQALCRLGLTQRQAEVLWCVVRGDNNATIATRLSISPRTVHKHLERIFVQLGVETRTEAALKAMATLDLG